MINKNKTFLLSFCLFFLFANFYFVTAANVEFVPQIGIPGSEVFRAGEKVEISSGSIIAYLSDIYKWSVGAIAIIAVIMIMIAGFQWMTAAGNASALGQARSRINSSLIGLLLAIGAYSLLNFVNPSLVYLRTLDIGNVDYVELKVAEKTCYNGFYSYDWYNYRCFTIMNDEYTPQFFPLSEFGVESLDANETYSEMVLDMGVDDNYVSECNQKDGFEAIEIRKNYITLFSSFILLDGKYNDDVEPEDDFYGYIKSGCTGIMAIAQRNSNDDLTGLNVTVANKSAGKASAYIKNIKIRSNTPCNLICCQRKDGNNWYGLDSPLSYWHGFECQVEGLELKLVPIEECDNEYCSKYQNNPMACGGLTEKMCIGVRERCNNACKWSPASISGGNCYPPGGY